MDVTHDEPRERLGGVGAVLSEELALAEGAGEAGSSVILVEGASDRLALLALAGRQGRDLTSEGISIVATTGATNFTRFVSVLGPNGHDVALAALCDLRERGEVRMALAATSPQRGSGPAVYTCVEDLEDELIRSIGPEAMLGLMAEHGDLRRFESFQNQPDQRHKTIDRQIWRWLGNHKIRYASLMVETLDLDRVPRSLQGALDHHRHHG